MIERKGDDEQQHHQGGCDLLEQQVESELGNTAVIGRGAPVNLVSNNNLGMMSHTFDWGRGYCERTARCSVHSEGSEKY